MRLIQTRLEREVECGKHMMHTCLPEDKRVKVGSVISLKGDPTKWTVAEQYGTLDSHEIETKWGLGLPKSQRTER